MSFTKYEYEVTRCKNSEITKSKEHCIADISHWKEWRQSDKRLGAKVQLLNNGSYMRYYESRYDKDNYVIYRLI